MKRVNPVAQLNTSEKSTLRSSWPVTAAELKEIGRELRSDKPEVLYLLKETPRRDTINVQPQPSPRPPVLPQLEDPVDNLNVSPVSSPPALDLDLAESEVFQAAEEIHQDPIVEDEENEEMAEEKNFTPTPFQGRVEDDGEDWLRHFLNYCAYKGYDDGKKLALLKVLLVGNAAIWFDSLVEPATTTFNGLKTAFEARYKAPEVLKYKSAKEIFSRRQKEDESVDNYIEGMRKLGRQIDADDKMIRYAILSGLKANISSFVTQRNPQSMEQLIDAARLAELTNTDQLTEVKAEIQRLAAKWDRLTTAPVGERSPSPRRVTFAQQPELSQPEPQRYQWNPGMNRGGNNPRQRGGYNPRSFGMRGSGNARSYQGPVMCQKCGRNAHQNMLYCPAANKLCNACHRRGHFAAVCRAATRGRSGTFTRGNY